MRFKMIKAEFTHYSGHMILQKAVRYAAHLIIIGINNG